MNNYHTHTARCRHASGIDKEYVENAIESGMKVLGFSDHAPMIFPTDDYYSTFRMYLKDAADYADSVHSLKKEYAGKIDIRLGFELEYYPDLFDKTIDFLNQFGYDYLILGQHFTDNEYEPYAHYSGHKTKDVSVLDKYIAQVLEGLGTGKFLYVAHPDLIHFTGSDKIYTEKMTQFCKNIKTLGYPVEFNLLGFAEHRQYPNKKFWNIVSQVGNDVVIGFDAHSPNVLRDMKTYKKALKYLEKLNIRPIEIEL